MRTLLLLPGLLLSGCSLGTYDYSPCENDGQCRAAFGLGHVCGSEGLCAAVAPSDRCTETWPDDLFANPSEYKDNILLGTLFSRNPVEGDLAEGLAVELAVRQVNDEGGLEGRPYALIQCDYDENTDLDSLTSTEAVQQNGQYLADMGAAFVVGPATSSMTQDVYAVMEAAGVMIVSPSATSPALTDIDGLEKSDQNPGLFWRTAPPDDLQGLAIAQDMAQRDRSNVAVIHETSNYGSALAEVFKTYFEASGGRTAALFPFDEGSASGRDTQVVEVAQGTYDEVIFISGNVNDYISFLNAAKDLAYYENVGIFLTDAGRDVTMLGATPEASALYDQVRGSAPAVPSGSLYDFFKAAYSAAYSPASADDSSYTSYAYDAAWLGIYGTVWSNYQEADACKGDDDGICGLGAARGLRKISAGEPLDIKATSWNTIKASFETGQGIDLEGSSGHLDYDPNSGETVGPVDIWVIGADNASFETVETIDPAGG